MNPDPRVAPAARIRSVLPISKMDCPSEENLFGMALGDVEGIGALSFDLGSRILAVDHQGAPTSLLDALAPLRLDAHLRESSELSGTPGAKDFFFETPLFA